jgi:acyl-CoA synthetase (AMP-forming)/AMP-acid ligase II
LKFAELCSGCTDREEDMMQRLGIETVSDLFVRSTTNKGNRDMLIDPGTRLTGRQTLDLALDVAAGFTRLAPVRASIVAFICRPSARHTVAWFGAIISGQIACNLHSRETGQKLGDTLNWLEADIVVYDEDNRDLALQAVKLSGRAFSLVSLADNDPANATIRSFSGEGAGFDFLANRPRPEDIACIILSSGTTGASKGITHTQHTLLESAKGTQQSWGPVVHSSKGLLYMQPSFAAWVMVTLCMIGGAGALVMAPQFTAEGLLKTVEQEKVTFIPLVPTMWRMVLAAHPENYDLSAVRVVTISGEPPTESDVLGLRDKICRDVRTAYQSGEVMSASGIINDIDNMLRNAKVGAAGRPMLGVQVAIIDPEGSYDDEMAIGEVGEIVISGPSVSPGYWKNDKLSVERLRDGWWRSGDLGRLDEDGDLWVVGRADNTINTGGIKVSAEEIEAAILMHPAVSQCAVVGQPDQAFGQRIEAYFIAAGETPASDELDRFLRERGLAGFKVPKEFHPCPSLPTGPTGKLYRRGLLRD